jgi:hypothetical protein
LPFNVLWRRYTTAEMVMKLNHSTYPANEFVLREGDLPDVLIFVNKGVVVCHGRVHTVGAVHVDPLRGQVRD